MRRRLEWIRLIALLAECLFIGACGERIIENDPPNTPEENFDILWQTFDRYYAHFETKSIDWDEVYIIYCLKVSGVSDRQLFEVCKEMLLLLKDGHVSLYTSFGNVGYKGWYKNYPENYSEYLIERFYLDRSPVVVGNGNIKYKRLSNGLGYIHIHRGEHEPWFRDIDKALDALKDTPAIILDVRNGGVNGGDALEFVLSRFADRRRLVYIFQYRNGPRHTDFSEYKFHVGPGEPIQYTRPIALLTNRRCFSASELFISGMREFPHVTTIGDTTGGGAGSGSARPFELPNGWKFEMPVGRLCLPDGTCFEGIGIPPDIPIHMTRADMVQGRDTIMETAISFLKSRIAEKTNP